MNEFELIAALTKKIPRRGKELLKGVGDDCAVISGSNGRLWLITSDALLEGIHFKLKWTDLRTLGRKALSVNLSDIAAMGGQARFYLVSIGLPRSKAFDTAREIYEGMNEVSNRFGVTLIGGDTVASNGGLVLSITAIGEVTKGRCLFRDGAKPGDPIYVSGRLGCSALGLECLKADVKGPGVDEFISRHLDPEPRIKEGLLLSRSGFVTSMIDISDGLMADLDHIAGESGVGYRLDSARIEFTKQFANIAKRVGADPRMLTLTGGEDYELLFTVDRNKTTQFEKWLKRASLHCKMKKIGVIVADESARKIMDENGAEIKTVLKGFDHFSCFHSLSFS